MSNETIDSQQPDSLDENVLKNETNETQDDQETNDSDTSNLERKIAELEKTLEISKAALLFEKDNALRSKAETENIRRRTEKEKANANKFALERFAKEILSVVDSLEKALELPVDEHNQNAVHEGIELTYKLMIDTLKKFSIEAISPLGDRFNPELHEAMLMQETEEHEHNSVMSVIQAGYQLNGRLIRPARVIVAKGKKTTIDEKA
jgi:molecular chaperone GrpE